MGEDVTHYVFEDPETGQTWEEVEDLDQDFISEPEDEDRINQSEDEEGESEEYKDEENDPEELNKKESNNPEEGGEAPEGAEEAGSTASEGAAGEAAGEGAKQAAESAAKEAAENAAKEAAEQAIKKAVEKEAEQLIAESTVEIWGPLAAGCAVILVIALVIFGGFMLYGSDSASGLTPSETAVVITGDQQQLIDTFIQYKDTGKIVVDGQINIDDVKNGLITEQTLRTMLTMADYLFSKGMVLRFSCGRSDHDQYTASGNISNHWYGKAFDIGNEEVASTLMPWAFQNRVTLQLDELIFNNSSFGAATNAYNVDDGQPHNYGTGTINQHTNHIHVSTN